MYNNYGVRKILLMKKECCDNQNLCIGEYLPLFLIFLYYQSNNNTNVMLNNTNTLLMNNLLNTNCNLVNNLICQKDRL